MRQAALALIIVTALAVAFVQAQTLHGVTVSATGGGAPVPPADCTGTIDGSEGCPLPVLGL